jgi:Na+-translocating ferredoxin:NAD+ oxidoreductase RnfE subunit
MMTGPGLIENSRAVFIPALVQNTVIIFRALMVTIKFMSMSRIWDGELD